MVFFLFEHLSIPYFLFYPLFPTDTPNPVYHSMFPASELYRPAANTRKSR